MLDCDEIVPGKLWVGGYIHEDAIPELQELGIGTVVSLQTDADLRDCGISPRRLAQAYQTAGIEWRRVPTPDFDNLALTRLLPDAVAVLRHALAFPDSRVYLHCTAGINRSPTIAAAFLMAAEGMSAQQACDHLMSRRACSPSFSVLSDYEIEVRASET